jgi:cytoskeletal protein CcmA (bactofilin family)
LERRKFSRINHISSQLGKANTFVQLVCCLKVAAFPHVAYIRGNVPVIVLRRQHMAVGESTTATIGKSVQIRGEVKGNEDLLVDGLVEGTITLSESRLTIGASARVQANVAARDVIVLGTLNGNINANGRVELRSGSRVTGDLRGARLSIEENAIFSGKVDLIQSSGSGEKASASASQPAVVSPEKPGALFGAAN